MHVQFILQVKIWTKNVMLISLRWLFGRNKQPDLLWFLSRQSSLERPSVAFNKIDVHTCTVRHVCGLINVTVCTKGGVRIDDSRRCSDVAESSPLGLEPITIKMILCPGVCQNIAFRVSAASGCYSGGGLIIARGDLERVFDHWFPACVFFCFLSGHYVAHTNSTFYARISTQWLSELRRLLPNVFWQVASELVSG